MVNINWKLFSEIHALTNSYTILAEELSDNYYANLQIVKEERDAYSHISTAVSDIDSAIQKENFDHALSHQYRALFDAMDWLSLVYRKQIEKKAKRHKQAFKIRNIDNELKVISEQIADCRTNKDVVHDSASTESAITVGIKKYIDALDKLNEIYDFVVKN